MAINSGYGYYGEYTPEITEEYLKGLQKDILNQGAISKGNAIQDSLNRGLSGDPYEAIRVQMAENNTSNALNNAYSKLAYDVAGLARDERLATENREDTQAYNSAEAALDRQFKKDYLALQSQYERDLLKYQNKLAKRNFWRNALGSALAYGTGAAVGKLV